MVCGARGKNKRPKPGRSSQARETKQKEDKAEGNEATAKKLQEHFVVASLVDWSGYDRMMAKMFYEKFGRVLEEKVADFERQKALLKGCFEKNYGGTSKVLKHFVWFLQKSMKNSFKH